MDAFEPDDCEAVLIENGAKVRITFARDSGASLEVILPRAWLPQLVALLSGKIEPGSVVPIDRDSLRPGQTIVVQSFQVRRASDGSRLLTVSAAIPDQDRIVTIPLEFSAGDAAALIKMLS